MAAVEPLSLGHGCISAGQRPLCIQEACHLRMARAPALGPAQSENQWELHTLSTQARTTNCHNYMGGKSETIFEVYKKLLLCTFSSICRP